MRRTALVDLVTRAEPAEAVRWIAAVYATADPLAVTALAALLAGGMSYALRASIYEAAIVAEEPIVARLLLESRDADPPVGPEQPTRPGGPAIPLGQRKALARDRRRDLLTLLLRDPDVGVVRNLLGNPRLIERDVVAMAARRPVRADVLRQIAESRWISRYHVKRAIVLNPHAPRELALRLLGALTKKDQHEIARDPKVAAELREQARALEGD
jgi:hypothetical protein